MFDPVTALGAATAAFKTIKAGIQVGKIMDLDAADLGGDGQLKIYLKN